MNHSTLPDHCTGDQALFMVAFLEHVIANVWARHGDAMKHAAQHSQWLIDSFQREDDDPREQLAPEEIAF